MRGGAGCRVRLVNQAAESAEGVVMEVQGRDTVITLTKDETDFAVKVSYGG